MTEYEDWVKRHQKEAMAQLQKEFAEAAAKEAKDPVKAERKALLFELGMLRFKKSVSQSELSVRTGLKQPYISRIEGGKANPSLNTLLKIAKALDATLVLD